MKKQTKVPVLKVRSHVKAGPHVSVGDKDDHWDFKKSPSFVLPDGTKIRMR